MIDRHLEIALTSGALAFAWTYIFQRRLRGRAAARKENQAGFWALMIILGLCEAIFVGLAVVNFAAWLSPA